MKKLIIIAALLITGIVSANAASNPQRMTGGGIRPVYVNGTGTSQSMASGVYINQTQYTPAITTALTRTLLGVGK